MSGWIKYSERAPTQADADDRGQILFGWHAPHGGCQAFGQWDAQHWPLEYWMRIIPLPNNAPVRPLDVARDRLGSSLEALCCAITPRPWGLPSDLLGGISDYIDAKLKEWKP
jgi:hypothetical protein